MGKYLVVAVLLPLTGCDWDAVPVCGPEKLPRRPDCRPEVEAAIEKLLADSRPIFDPPLVHALGDHLGEVVEVGEGQVELSLLGERRTLRWPEGIPFSLDPGEEFMAQIDEGAVTLFFSRGALAFPRDGMGTVARIGDTETVRERGCLSTRGLTFNLHVGDVVLRPGETRQVGSWTIRYDGAVRFVEDTGCAIDADTVRWFATSTELRYACEPPQVPGSQCSAEIEEADRRGREHNFGPGVEAGTYEVVTVGATGFGLRAAGSDQVEFAWPEALPVEVVVGDEVVVESSNGWTVLSLPRGQLAVSRRRWGFVFSPPDFGPDGAVSIEPIFACALAPTTAAMGVALRQDETEVRLFPGESAAVGDWTYGLLLGWQVGPHECRKGNEVLWIAEGMGEGALVAYRASAGGQVPSE